MDEELRLYFAYGSNMSIDNMKEKGMDVTFLGVGYLDHYKFMLNKISKKDPTVGFANVVPCWNKRVYGTLFDIGKTDEILQKNLGILDKKEGYPNHYERTTISIYLPTDPSQRFGIRKDGLPFHCFTYMAGLEMQAKGNLIVREEYVNKINEGFESFEVIKSAGFLFENESLDPAIMREKVIFKNTKFTLETKEFENYKRETKELMGIWMK